MTTRHWRVPPNQVETVWSSIEEKIQAILDTGGQYDACHAKDFVVAGEWQLWLMWTEGSQVPTIKCIVITTVQEYPKLKELVLIACAGEDREDWMEHLETIEAWGRYMRCDRVKAISRPGWEKILKDYRKTHVQLEKIL